MYSPPSKLYLPVRGKSAPNKRKLALKGVGWISEKAYLILELTIVVTTIAIESLNSVIRKAIKEEGFSA